MKKILLTLAIALVASYGFSQPLGVIINVDNGMVYTRILTVEEYLSVGGSIEGMAADPLAKGKYTVAQLKCMPGGSSCWSSRWLPNLFGLLGSVTIIEQTGDDGSYMPETPDMYAYYNAEVDEIIFRSF